MRFYDTSIGAPARRDAIRLLPEEKATQRKTFFPELEELRQSAKKVVVDGEIVTMKQGKVDFHSLQERGYVISARDLKLLLYILAFLV